METNKLYVSILQLLLSIDCLPYNIESIYSYIMSLSIKDNHYLY